MGGAIVFVCMTSFVNRDVTDHRATRRDFAATVKYHVLITLQFVQVCVNLQLFCKFLQHFYFIYCSIYFTLLYFILSVRMSCVIVGWLGGVCGGGAADERDKRSVSSTGSQFNGDRRQERLV